jgi:hypothetical protein
MYQGAPNRRAPGTIDYYVVESRLAARFDIENAAVSTHGLAVDEAAIVEERSGG